MTRMPIWLHLRDVPLELFTKEGLRYIASVVGKPFYMDRITVKRERVAYAKVCVEIGATTVIPSIIKILMPDGSRVVVAVDVPWLPPKCS
ncbi:hypothetical protein PTKIN_Ptkin07bG0101300 [Pterospermum kingtungense]